MPYAFFWVPVVDHATEVNALNKFLSSHAVVSLTKEFVSAPDLRPGWSFCIEWVQGEGEPATTRRSKGKVDYREILDADTFTIFAAIRAWRKEIATAEGVPLYSVMTNEQMARIATDRICSKSGLEAVDGFGASRMRKYGDALLSVCEREMQGESRS